FRPENYVMYMNIDLAHLQGAILPNQSDMKLTWNIVSPQEEKGFQNENNYTTIAYKYPGETSIEELGMSTGTEEEEVKTKVHWVAFKQQFFSSIIVANDNFGSADLRYNTFPPTDTNIKDFSATMTLPYSAGMTQGYDLQFYFGPNKYSVLKQYGDLEFQKLVPLGWWIIGWVNRYVVIPVFDFLGSYISNFGIVILILTVIIKLLIFPLTYKSYLSTAKMRLLKPDIDKLNEKYPRKEDAMKKQQAMMQLYKSAGVNPMGGCLPMLIQFPILIAMFRFFPAAIELRDKSFLWADDLSSYDSIWNFPHGFSIPFYGDHVSLFALLMAASLFVSSKINYAQSAGMSSQQMPGMKFMMLYLMPILLLVWFNNYSAGLCYYYFLANIITIGQTFAFRYIVNDQKLHAQMMENTKKPVKKSKWQLRLEEMQRQQEALRKQQQQQQQPV
ncbi:MAG: membrane protein insertase YidC, partial [Rikenella sp.]|nr:membrane protein insertase YidC [Rikenella sp.]